jgi:putrescine transport system substrate-binding protein
VRGASTLASFFLAAAVVAGCGRPEPTAGSQTSRTHADAGKTLSIGAQTGTLSAQSLDAVRKRSGLRLQESQIKSGNELESRLLAGGSGFDVVVMPWQFVARQVRAGLFHKLDKRQLPNLQQVDTELMTQLAASDPGNELAVPYRRQTAGIAVDRQRVAELIHDADPHDWSMVFDVQRVAKLAGCGVSVPDAPAEMMGLALLWLGRDPNSERSEDLAAAAAALNAIKPSVQLIDPARRADELAARKPCLAVVRDSDTIAQELDYGVPLQGTITWVDVLAIPADARQLAQAHAFINTLIEAEQAPDGATTAGAPAKSVVLSPHSEAYAAEVAHLWAEFTAH